MYGDFTVKLHAFINSAVEYQFTSGMGENSQYRMRQEAENKLPLVAQYTDVPLYPRVIRSKTYRGYVKPWIIQKAIYNVIFV
jgi:hypothetical protein